MSKCGNSKPASILCPSWVPQDRELLWQSSSELLCCPWHGTDSCCHQSRGQESSWSWKTHQVCPDAQKAKWMLSPAPATPVLISGGSIVSKLFVPTGHLNLILKDWLVVTMPHETFRRKGECFVDHLSFFVCVAGFKWLVLKTSTF